MTNADILKLHKATEIFTVYLKKSLGMVDIKKVLEEAKADYEKSDPAEKNKAQKNWDLLAIKFIEESLNFEEAHFLWNYKLIRSGSNSKPWELVQKKCSDFGMPLVKKANATSEIKNFYQRFPRESEAYKKAIDKWNELTMADLGDADTVDKVKKVLNDSYNPSPANDAGKKKLDALATALSDKAKNQSEALNAYRSASF